MASASDCVFCKIITGDIPALVVWQSDHAVAFLDIAPLAEGHTLVVPQRHHQRLEDIPAEELAPLSRDLQRVARAVVQATTATGYNLLQNNGRVAGQLVNHVHFHIIPRHEGDGLGYRWNAGKYPAGRAETLSAQIRNHLAAGD